MLTLKPPVYMASGSFPRDPILYRACGGETRGGPLAAVALVAAPVLVPEAAVRGVCWRDQGCGLSTISRTSRAANIFFMLFSLGISGGSACLSQPPVPWH